MRELRLHKQFPFFFYLKTNTMKNNIRIVHASVPGARHLAENIPCQDSHIVATTVNGVVLAVISDGAGTARNSEIGSAFITKNALQIFGSLINSKGWFIDGKLPTKAEWKIQSTRMFRDLHHRLAGYATAIEKPVKNLLGTCIVLVSNGKDGALISHIGDGRAAVRNSDGQWNSALMPCNGDQPNATMFIGVDIWTNREKIDLWTEARVIKTPVTGFAMMSDGCEVLFYKTRIFDENGEEVDANEPIQDNFELNYLAILNSEEESAVNGAFKDFLLNSEQLKDEPDDKTMILGTFEFGSTRKASPASVNLPNDEQPETPNCGSSKEQEPLPAPKVEVVLESDDKNEILEIAEEMKGTPMPGNNETQVKDRDNRETLTEIEKMIDHEQLEQDIEDCSLRKDAEGSQPHKKSFVQMLLKILKL